MVKCGLEPIGGCDSLSAETICLNRESTPGVVSQKYVAKPYQEIIALSFVKSVRSIIKDHIALSEYDMIVHSIVIYFWDATLAREAKP